MSFLVTLVDTPIPFVPPAGGGDMTRHLRLAEERHRADRHASTAPISRNATAATILALQRAAGNGAVAALLPVQRDACLIPDRNTPYSQIGKTGNVGPGEHFDSRQRRAILKANFRGVVARRALANMDIQFSDLSSKPLYDPRQLRPAVAEIDHIVPREMGGGNTERNAQVLSGRENGQKGATYPWGAYRGLKIYDPETGGIFDTLRAAVANDAELGTLRRKFPLSLRRLPR
jgi:hypothetical protein